MTKAITDRNLAPSRVSTVLADASWQHKLPPLPYAYAALEPAIDKHTMQHHHAHHRAYVKQLNIALQKYPALQKKSAQWLLLNLDLIPIEIRQSIRINAGGHANHSLFWRAMSPALKKSSHNDIAPTGELYEAIVREFGSFDFFKTLFSNTAASHFGSGWVWLTRAQEDGGRLELITTEGNDNPLAQGCYPLLVCDVWEHAYYLQHKNNRPQYLLDWWDVINWREAERRYAEAKNRVALHPKLARTPRLPLTEEFLRHAA